MIEVLYSDEQIIVAIKPAGLLSQSDSAENGMEKLLSEQLSGRVYPVHRLDQPVCGVMVYARTKTAAASLSKQIADGSVRKQYLCIAEGAIDSSGEMTDLLFKDQRTGKTYPVKSMRKGVREAKLYYEVLEEKDGVSLCRVTLLTGRSHQIRAQFAARRHPLLGDGRYGSKRNCPIALFSYRLEFTHPKTGEWLSFSSRPEGKPWDMFLEESAQ
ncbi:MAG: RluA family pseudouridine synthase [Clostridia bacterium]|nr:RluA family pseudouridine synthase [Clostridia bacterium]